VLVASVGLLLSAGTVSAAVAHYSTLIGSHTGTAVLVARVGLLLSAGTVSAAVARSWTGAGAESATLTGAARHRAVTPLGPLGPPTVH